MPKIMPFQPPKPATVDPETQWRSEQGRAHTKAVRLADKVAETISSGKRAAPAVRTAIRDPQARLSAALKAMGGSPPREDAIDLMRRVNAWEENYSPILWHAKRKSSGTERYICRLPVELKAAHYLLKRPLERLLMTEGNIYGVKWRSRDDLAHEIKNLQNQGFDYIAVTDIVDCYQSIDPDAVYQLPLPKEVIRRTLDLRNQTLVEDHQGAHFLARSHGIVLPYDITQKARGPKGLMQGSPLSGLILAWLLNGIPTRENARVYLCFDNLIVLARTPTDSRAMVDTLAAHFQQCPAGPLALCDPIYSDKAPVDFLGYLFDPELRGVSIDISNRNKFLRKLNKAEEAQAKQYEELLFRYQRRPPSSIPYSPLRNHFPAAIWDILLSFRAGFPAVSNDDLELLGLIENTRWLVEWTDDAMALLFHDNLFSGRESEFGKAIYAIVERRKRTH